MKPYQELTYRGRLRRLGQLAQVALEAYGLAGARLKLLQDSGNVTYRVDAPSPAPAQVDQDLYVAQRYALRMHEPGYQSDAAIASELSWLAALRRDADLPVPEPVPALSGELLVEVGIPGVPEPRRCSLLRWVRGRMLTPQHVSPRHLRAVGRIMARMHQHAARWQPPAGFSRPRYDWAGLYGDTPLVKVPASVVWPLLPRAHIEPFTAVTGQLRQVMEELGQGPGALAHPGQQWCAKLAGRAGRPGEPGPANHRAAGGGDHPPAPPIHRGGIHPGHPAGLLFGSPL